MNSKRSNQKRRRNSNAFVVHTLPQVAEFFGVSVGTVNGWRSRGMPGIAGVGKSPGRFDLQKIAKWRFNRDDMKETSLDCERLTKLEILKRRQEIHISQLRLEKLEREIIDVEFATYVIKRIIEEHGICCDELAERLHSLMPKTGSTVREGDGATIAEFVELNVGELRNAMAACLEGWRKESETSQEG